MSDIIDALIGGQLKAGEPEAERRPSVTTEARRTGCQEVTHDCVMRYDHHWCWWKCVVCGSRVTDEALERKGINPVQPPPVSIGNRMVAAS